MTTFRNFFFKTKTIDGQNWQKGVIKNIKYYCPRKLQYIKKYIYIYKKWSLISKREMKFVLKINSDNYLKNNRIYLHKFYKSQTEIIIIKNESVFEMF